MDRVALSFIAFLAVFAFIGVLSAIRRRKSAADYLIASHSVSPLFAALSAVSTNNSGYMFVGMIGFTYLYGLSSIWLMVGWIFGDFLISLFVHKKLRVMTEKSHSLSYPEVITRWSGGDYKIAQFFLGMVVLVFLGVYAAAQLKAGGKALNFIFDWEFYTGSIIGFLIILMYCYAGGIRATIWTDVAQSCVMLVAMLMLLLSGLQLFGGVSATIHKLSNVSTTYMSLYPPGDEISANLKLTLFIISWVIAGIGVIGQPHIMVRFMALKDPNSFWKTRFYYYLWYVLFYAMTICAGLLARLIFTEVDQFDPEIALLKFANAQLPPMLVGAVLAGLFAAIMSTADSQILSCTASAAQDILRVSTSHYILTKMLTVFIASLALCIALFADENVFNLVLIAWSALSSVFAPLLILLVMNIKLNEVEILLISCSGLLTTIVWRLLGYDAIVYEILPGMMAGFVMFALWRSIRQLTKSVAG